MRLGAAGRFLIVRAAIGLPSRSQFAAGRAPSAAATDHPTKRRTRSMAYVTEKRGVHYAVIYEDRNPVTRAGAATLASLRVPDRRGARRPDAHRRA